MAVNPMTALPCGRDPLDVVDDARRQASGTMKHTPSSGLLPFANGSLSCTRNARTTSASTAPGSSVSAVPESTITPPEPSGWSANADSGIRSRLAPTVRPVRWT